MPKPFDVERVTKRFYEKFKVERAAFVAAIAGIGREADREWFASLMLNRLMFLYFVQQKNFLDDNPDYLRHHLERTRQSSDEHVASHVQHHHDASNILHQHDASHVSTVSARHGASHAFYGRFLRRLFHEGLARESRTTPALVELFGRVPYLGGGLFDVHELERAHPCIEIDDGAFERIFDFFDTYRWHLDDRPLSTARDINPDVLGYIFEKYVNQKQMGAYYTKQDITGYISKNAIITFVFETVGTACPAALLPDGAIFARLRRDPDRYIYEAARHGVVRDGATLALPPEIAAGLDDVERRGAWNRAADEAFALPTETWREHVARRRHCLELRARIAAGEVATVNDLVTYNLDIGRLAGDVIADCATPELLRAFYRAVTRITVLDPTCGSGAFLFAAMNVLEPLYDACLRRMQSFADDDGFRAILERAAEQVNRRYFILKSIISSNLYGVDMMPEAVEICRLRLFLKLAAQVAKDASKPHGGLEPLPDIDFNIRSGNALVGMVDEMEAVGELDGRLAREYGVNVGASVEFERWRESHRPFHWSVEFRDIIGRGGFDVIIGNPPYVASSRVRAQYDVPPRRYRTEATGNLYALVLERAEALLARDGSLAMIIPLSAFCTQRMTPLIEFVKQMRGAKWLAHFGWRPATLFEGVNIPLSILLSRPGARTTHTTALVKWYKEYRPALFANLQYAAADDFLCFKHVIPKIGAGLERRILKKMFGKRRSLGDYQCAHAHHAETTHQSASATRTPAPLAVDALHDRRATLFYRNTGGLYWRIFTDFQPFFTQNGHPMSSSTESSVAFDSRETLALAAGVLNSNLYWFFYVVFSSFHHVNAPDISAFPIDFDEMDAATRAQLSGASASMLADLRRRSQIRQRVHRGGHVSRMQTFFPSLSKPLVDRIDHILARHYNLDADELDFILNYDIKFRAPATVKDVSSKQHADKTVNHLDCSHHLAK